MTDRSVFLIRPYFSYTDNQDYPLLYLHRNERGYFLSLSRAEQAMLSMKEGEQTLCLNDDWDDFEKFSHSTKRFKGREDSQIRFKVGDLVEVLHPASATAELMIVGRVPFSPDRVMEIESDPDNPSRDIPDEYACLPIDGKESYRKYMEEMKAKHINPRRTW